MDDIRIDRLIRSKRKTIGLQVTPGGELVVRIPYFLKSATLADFIQKKAPWIKSKQDEARRRTISRPEFRDGERFLFLGRYFRLKITQDKRFLFDNAFYLPKDLRPRARDLMVSWYRREAKKYITGRVQKTARDLNISYLKINITSAGKRWGSCSAGGNLNFPYRLVMAPPVIIDYVIVHELLHILERNHSRRFWKEVEKVMPGYRKYRAWLKDNGHLMVI